MSEFIEEPDTIRNELMDNGALIGEQMTTNGEWLDYLAHNAPDELAAWFDAERITNQAEMLHMPESSTSATMQHIGQVIEDTVKRGVYGDTEPQNADSRELLDADVRKWCGEYAYQADMVWTWLNRQAAITSEETSNAWEEYRDATQREIAELKAERDKLQERLNRTTSAMNSAAGKWARANEQCNEYREKFSKCLDYADAIHALMDDEGMA